MTETDEQKGDNSFYAVIQRFYDGEIQADDVRRIVDARLRAAQPDSERISRLDIFAALIGGIGGGTIVSGAVYILDALTKEPASGMGELAWRFAWVMAIPLGFSAGAFVGLYLSRKDSGREMMKF